MFKHRKQKDEVLTERLLEQLVTVITLRTSLTHLREGRTSEAVQDMEIHLDVLITSISENLDSNKATVRALIKEELKRVHRYRDANRQDLRNCLAGADEVTRNRLLDLRSRVEEVLRQYG